MRLWDAWHNRKKSPLANPEQVLQKICSGTNGSGLNELNAFISLTLLSRRSIIIERKTLQQRRRKRMKWMHMQTTLTICAGCTEKLTGLPEVILRHTDLDYACRQTDAGCVLTPTFRHIPYRNGFVPEIEIAVSHEEEQTVLHITGQSTRFSRIFWACLYGFLLLMEVLLLVFAAELDTLLFLLIPVGFGVFGYVLCRCATKFTFASVVKAIQKAFC